MISSGHEANQWYCGLFFFWGGGIFFFCLVYTGLVFRCVIKVRTRTREVWRHCRMIRALQSEGQCQGQKECDREMNCAKTDREKPPPGAGERRREGRRRKKAATCMHTDLRTFPCLRAPGPGYQKDGPRVDIPRSRESARLQMGGKKGSVEPLMEISGRGQWNHCPRAASPGQRGKKKNQEWFSSAAWSELETNHEMGGVKLPRHRTRHVPHGLNRRQSLKCVRHQFKLRGKCLLAQGWYARRNK